MANPLERFYAKAYFKYLWGDGWIPAPMVKTLNCVKRAAPGIGQASFLSDYGLVKDHGSATFNPKGPLDLVDWYVKISLCDAAGNEIKPCWYGVIPRASDMQFGGMVGGSQVFQALGLEHLLDRRDVTASYVANSDSSPAETRIMWFPGFNEQEKKGAKGFVGNRSRNFGQEGTYVFSANSPKRWTAYQAALYLLKRFPAREGFNWDFASHGQYEALNDIEEVWSPMQQLSLWQWLNLLIDRRRGLSFYIEPRPGAEQNVDIIVFTVVGEDVNIGERTLPANNWQRIINPPTTFAESHLFRPIEFSRSTLSKFDTIEVLGERVTTIATYSFQDNTLVRGWREEDEQYYYNASEEARTSDYYDGMFTRFIVRDGWDRFMGSILSAPCQERINMKATEDGLVEAGLASVGGVWKRRQRMERNMPLISTLDYSTYPPTTLHGPLSPGDDREYDEWKPLFAFCQLPAHIFGGGNNVWRQLDRLAENNTGLPNCHVRALDKSFGFEIGASPRHLFARLNWPLDANGAFKKAAEVPQLFHTHIAVTAAVKADERLRVMVDTATDTYTNTKGYRHKTFEVPGADYWRVLKGTVVGIKDGKLIRIHNSGTVVRDDRDLLDGIASFAVGWYGKEREPIIVTMNRPDDTPEWTRLGAYIPMVTGNYNRQVNTVVSEVSMEFDKEGLTTVQTGWGDYDIMGAILDEKKGIASKRANWEWQMWG